MQQTGPLILGYRSCYTAIPARSPRFLWQIRPHSSLVLLAVDTPVEQNHLLIAGQGSLKSRPSEREIHGVGSDNHPFQAQEAHPPATFLRYDQPGRQSPNRAAFGVN
jgi:hypothetical protein